MRRSFPVAVAVLFTATSLAAQGGMGRGGRGTPIQPGEQCPPGMTEIRPRTCMAPEFAAPSIVDYRPRNTLKVTEHKVPKAKFPAVDYHAHVGQYLTAGQIDSLATYMDQLGLGAMVVADNISGDRLKTAVRSLRLQASAALGRGDTRAAQVHRRRSRAAAHLQR